MVRVHLVRHGEVENPAHVTYGRLPGFGLSERGRRQARRAAAWLAGELGARVALVSSPLERARETAGMVAEALAARGGTEAPRLRLDAGLVEAGSWREGLPRRWAPRAYLAAALDARARARKEHPRAVAARMRRALLAALAAEPDLEDLVCVSHQQPIWMARVAFEHGLAGPEEPLAVRLMPWLFVRGRCTPASVTTLVLERGALRHTSYWEPGREP
ncbi:MAG: histidine phosphatase family protein [Polyangiaceae bacterium]|nr:histidine phosphatase family protein [Polyangiaceae bacterium]